MVAEEDSLRTLHSAAEFRRPGRAVYLAALAAVALLALATQSEAAVSVTYSFTATGVAQGGHQVSFEVSQRKGSSTTSLAAYVQRVDSRGTASEVDDTTETHAYRFSLPASALVLADTLGSASFNSGALKGVAGSLAGSGADYGQIQVKLSNLGPITTELETCSGVRSRAAKATGTVKFNTFLAGVGKVNSTSMAAVMERSFSKYPCDAGPQECVDAIVFSASVQDDRKGLDLYSLQATKGSTRSIRFDFRDPTAQERSHSLTTTFPTTALRSASNLKTAKLDGGPIDRMAGALTFSASIATMTLDGGDCPDHEYRSGPVTGLLKVDFTAGDDYIFKVDRAQERSMHGSIRKYTKS